MWNKQEEFHRIIWDFQETVIYVCSVQIPYLQFQLSKVNWGPKILNFPIHGCLLLTSKHDIITAGWFRITQIKWSSFWHHHQVSSSLRLHHNTYVIHLTSSQHVDIIYIITHHHKKGEHSTDFERLHSHNLLYYNYFTNYC